VTLDVRPARTGDVPGIRQVIGPLADARVLIAKEAVAYYEALQEFTVAELDGRVVGCGALHVMWDDLAEIRTLGVREDFGGLGIGHAVLEALIERARGLGVDRLFCLTFEVDFFIRHGFDVIQGTPVEPHVFVELLRSHDDGVAEFLDLARVKPNTLGNTRMMRVL